VTHWLATVVLAAGLLGCSAWRGARLYQSGTAALDRGEIEVALVELSHAARLVPEASEVHNHLGIAQLEADRIGLARESFERAVELDCDNHAASNNLERVRAIERVSGP
jgi:Flp pilus assembly protein TadD